MTEWDRLYLEINYLALLINRHTKFAVWVAMEGHVSWTRIEVSSSKKAYNDKIITDEIVRHAAGANFEKDDQDIEKMIRIRNQLKRLLEEGNFDYEVMNREQVTSWEYSF